MWPITALGGAAAVLGAWAGLLVHADLTWRRLPDRLTVPAAVGALAGALLTDPFLLVPGLVWPALYLLVGIAAGGVGGGDLKLAVPLGVLVAAAGGTPAVLAAIFTSAAGGVVAGMVSRSGQSAHGPAMILSAAAVGCWFLLH
jgi:leader peptidase (prepilin peptidase) / N-methyltransferase